MGKKHEVVITGGGHNGLTVAGYLAKAGVDVCVVEALSEVGGCVISPELDVTEEVRKLGKALIADGHIPEGSKRDAYHVAVAAVNGMDYLITWNCVYIANAVIRPQLEIVCREQGFEPLIICTLQELMEG